jgi:hypothetical protein
VSILSIGIGAATPVNVVNLSMHSSFLRMRASRAASLFGVCGERLALPSRASWDNGLNL